MPLYYKWGGGLAPDHPTVTDASEEFLRTDDGREIIDGAAGAAVANLGHSPPVDSDDIQPPFEGVGYLSLSHFDHEAPTRLAAQLEALTPGTLDVSLFAGSGSEANEAAMKFAKKYHTARGNPGKSTVIGRWQSYHGSTLGALSASGNTGRRRDYDGMLASWPHIEPAYPYRWDHAGTETEQARTAARELEIAIRQQGAENVAAFIAEPVGGSSIPAAHPPAAYYEEIRRICDEYDVLFIADEVMTGFGRTGEWFAMEHYDVTPDIMTVGKGLSAGFAPVSATVFDEALVTEFETDLEGAFDHGHTYSGHPPSMQVASAVLESYTEDLLQTARDRGDRLAAHLDELASHEMVGEVRSIGQMHGIEFVADPETKTPFDPDRQVARRVYDAALERDVYVYPGGGSVDGVAGDHIMIAPPLTISEASIDRIGTAVAEAITNVAASME